MLNKEIEGLKYKRALQDSCYAKGMQDMPITAYTFEELDSESMHDYMEFIRSERDSRVITRVITSVKDEISILDNRSIDQ